MFKYKVALAYAWFIGMALPALSQAPTSQAELENHVSASGGEYIVNPDGSHVIKNKNGAVIEFTPGKSGWKVRTPAQSPEEQGKALKDFLKTPAGIELQKKSLAEMLTLPKVDPRVPVRLRELAQFFTENHLLTEAEQSLERLRELDQQNDSGAKQNTQLALDSVALAENLINQKKFQEANELYDEYADSVLKSHPELMAVIENDMAYTKLQLGKLKEAERHYKIALEHVESTTAQYKRFIFEGYATVLEKTGRVDEARQLRERVAALSTPQ